MIPLEPIGFYLASAALIFFAYKVVTAPNPVHCALYLALTMIGLAGVFFKLNAHFIAGVQLIVYAGAVMVMFVMVVMLFDLRHEIRSFSRGLVSGLFKIMSAALLAGYLIGAVGESPLVQPGQATLAQSQSVTQDLSLLLFSNYLLIFEVLGVLLLVIAVGVVAVSRVKGGTHAVD